MAFNAKILTRFVLLIALLSAGAAKIITTKEELLAEREKRTVHLQHAMAMLQKQIDEHDSGLKRLDEGRVKSLKNRLHSYKGQIYDLTRTLSEEEIMEELGKHGEL